MMQQINFYLPEFQPNREPFRSSQILIASAILFLLLIAVTFKTSSDNKLLAQALEADKLQLQGLKDQLQEFANSKRQINVVELDNQIIQLKSEIERRQQLMQVISYQELGNDRGFSTQLEAMAKQSNADISLEIFSIKNGGNYVELVGKTTSADQLPAYIRSLKSEDAFRKVGFGVLHIQPVKSSGSGFLQFVLAEPSQSGSLDAESAVQRHIKDHQDSKGQWK